MVVPAPPGSALATLNDFFLNARATPPHPVRLRSASRDLGSADAQLYLRHCRGVSKYDRRMLPTTVSGTDSVLTVCNLHHSLRRDLRERMAAEETDGGDLLTW